MLFLISVRRLNRRDVPAHTLRRLAERLDVMVLWHERDIARSLSGRCILPLARANAAAKMPSCRRTG